MTSIATPQVSMSSVRGKAIVALVVLAAFTAYSLWVISGSSYTGFLALADRDAWGMQMLIDLVIACSFGLGWLTVDARKRGIAAWPYVIVTLFLGSIGLLAYYVRRGLVPVTPRPET